MGKSAKKRKRQNLIAAVADSAAPINTPTRLQGSVGKGKVLKIAAHDVNVALPVLGAAMTEDPLGGLPAQDVAAAVRALTFLAARPDVFRAKPLKSLRAALHSLTSSKAMETTGRTLVGRASDAFRDGRWEDALTALQAMQASGQAPKLGALCRWVRDCDAASGFDDPLVCRVMDAALRVTTSTARKGAAEGSATAVEGGVVLCEPWDGARATPTGDSSSPCADNARTNDDGNSKCDIFRTEDEYRARFRVVQHLAASDRQPPNKHDLHIYTSEEGTIRLDSHDTRSAVTRANMPSVPGAFMLRTLLSRAECGQILRAAHSVGFAPDEPASGGMAAVLAHAFVWLADPALNAALFLRCRHLLPPEMGGGEVVGLNARWRVYRYIPGAVYRPHIDGAWPGSGLSEDGRYLYDAYGDRWSRLTFLIYLNSQGESFEGGSTTYFVPSGREGWLEAHGTVPTIGCAMVFPHGETAGSLLHEGSAVTSGEKYVIRTEVLYKKPSDARGVAPEAETIFT